MDRRLDEALLKGDLQAFLHLVEEDESVLDQRVPRSLNTSLHVASKCCHKELVAAMVDRWPEMVLMENARMETPLHEACLEGHLEVCKMLLEADPSVAYKRNCDGDSVLFVSCGRGHLDVVRLFLGQQPLLLISEEDGSSTSLHAAVAGGFTDIVREILSIRQDFAWKRDGQGFTPLHIAATKGHLEITREFLKIDADLCFVKDNDGRSPLHAAAIKGRVAILDEILSASLDSASLVTNQGETILHLCVKNNQYDALRYLVEKLDITLLINLPDNNGNTVLHLATAGKLSVIVRYLVSKTGVNVNALNNKGFTALDVVETDASNSGALLMGNTLLGAGGQRGMHLPPSSPLDIQITSPPRFPTNNPSRSNSSSRPIPPSPPRSHCRRLEIHSEGLRNARNTITVVAVLIATVTFAAGISPPGGVHQESGKSIAGRTAPFKVFTVTNNVALFLSLGIVVVLVSVIPFRRKAMMNLLTITHKVLWVAVSFLAVAYIAAMWVIVPLGSGSKWVLVVVLSIGAGTVGSLFVWLGMMLVRHWLRKSEWKKAKERRKKGSPNSSTRLSHVDELRAIRKKGSRGSSNSDVESSGTSGYHIY
ncbi:Ankyrin repeat [Cinnamomum micranthum f. kanehirae]|uniref:Ankyrin repeat n=1 Tax=Cinnamomum micranthum f. kanehirae TaxID=337451 RepID=A0A443N1S9_9MAGN|nr:Ankyrin repeat [Cinnamomum micranthum f. kanehirae]